tara:strand:- start:574 stop:747 length:174 start_codon:yes stop_codon:yes gene_type:complete
MWRALIKLVERLAYRCEHDWYLEQEQNVYGSNNTDKLPIRIERTYVCKKCMKVKKIK